MLKLSKTELSRIDKSIFLFFIIYSLHTLRNLNLFFYFFLFFFGFLNLIISLIIDFSSLKFYRFDIFIYLFVFTLLLLPINSFLNLSFNEFYTAITRYIPPTLFFLLLGTIRPKNHNLHLKIIDYFIFFTVLAAFSIFFQLYFEIEIPFLADSTIREGLVRYSSLLGSLTSFGTLGPLALFSIIIFIDKSKLLSKSNFKYFFYAVIILSASIITLQKAAILNILIVFFFSLFFFKIKTIIRISLFIMFLVFMIYYFFGSTYVVTTLQTMINYTFLNGSLSFVNDFVSRATFYISIFLDSNNMNFFRFIFGFGFKALSGILGLNNYVMLHNNYYDIFFSGGLLHILSFLLLILESLFLILRNYKKGEPYSDYSKFLFFSVVYVLINMTIGASTFYHPIGGTFFFLLLIFSRVTFQRLKTNPQPNLKFWKLDSLHDNL